MTGAGGGARAECLSHIICILCFCAGSVRDSGPCALRFPSSSQPTCLLILQRRHSASVILSLFLTANTAKTMTFYYFCGLAWHFLFLDPDFQARFLFSIRTRFRCGYSQPGRHRRHSSRCARKGGWMTVPLSLLYVIRVARAQRESM